MNLYNTRLERIYINAANLRNLFNATHLSLTPIGVSGANKKLLKSKDKVVLKQGLNTAPVPYKPDNSERLNISSALQNENKNDKSRITTNNHLPITNSSSKGNSSITEQETRLLLYRGDASKSSAALSETNSKPNLNRKINADALLPLVIKLTGDSKLPLNRMGVSLVNSISYAMPIYRSLYTVGNIPNYLTTKNIDSTKKLNNINSSFISNWQIGKVTNAHNKVQNTNNIVINNRLLQEPVNHSGLLSTKTTNTDSTHTIANQNAININQYEIRGLVEKVLAEIIDTITPNF